MPGPICKDLYYDYWNEDKQAFTYLALASAAYQLEHVEAGRRR